MEDTHLYRTLEDIDDRKEEIRTLLRNSDSQIREKWHSLFHEEEPLSALSPTRRFTRLIHNSAGFIDGALLAWKLYRVFKKRK